MQKITIQHAGQSFRNQAGLWQRLPLLQGLPAEPGAVCAHTHLYSGLAPLGLPAPQPPPENFVQILERLWWRLDRALDEASLRAAARLYVAEALLRGTTALIDHHESPNLIEGSLEILAEACQELGMRAWLCYGATERNGGLEEGRRGLAECRRFIRENQRPLLRGMVGLHASFTVSDELIREAGALCREMGAPMHIHLAEDIADVRDAQKRGYPGPLERLESLGALAPGALLIHAVHLKPEQVHTAAEEGAWFVHNPRSNRGNQVGYASALSAAPKQIALGTDGYPAHMEEERQALEVEALAHDDPSTAGRLENGLELIAELMQRPYGRFEEGAPADCVIRQEGKISEVIIAGQRVVQGGELLTGDLQLIHAEAAEQAERLWARMRALP